MVLEDKLQVQFQTSGVISEVILFNFTFSCEVRGAWCIGEIEKKI